MDKLPGDCVRSYSTHRTCSYTISYVMSTRERQSNYFLFAFTACLRPRDYLRRPSRMETGVWCSPGLVYSSPPFGLRHLTYATSCRTSGLINGLLTASDKMDIRSAYDESNLKGACL